MTENSLAIQGTSGSCEFSLPFFPKVGMVVKLGDRWVVFTKINPPIIEYAELNWFKAQALRFIYWAREVK